MKKIKKKQFSLIPGAERKGAGILSLGGFKGKYKEWYWFAAVLIGLVALYITMYLLGSNIQGRIDDVISSKEEVEIQIANQDLGGLENFIERVDFANELIDQKEYVSQFFPVFARSLASDVIIDSFNLDIESGDLSVKAQAPAPDEIRGIEAAIRQYNYWVDNSSEFATSSSFGGYSIQEDLVTFDATFQIYKSVLSLREEDQEDTN